MVKSTQKPVTKTASTPAIATNQPQPKKNNTPWIIGCFCCGCATLFLIILLIIGGVIFLGKKGQPGTIIKPTSEAIKTPKDLKVQGVDSAIDLNWQKSGSSAVTKYNVYKSTADGKNYAVLTTIESTTNLNYKDSSVEKGKTYYYVVTGVSPDNKESGNSNQVAYALESAPLLPNGVQNWADVLTKFDADKKYADLFTKVSGLSRSDIERFIILESQGKNMKKKLLKGTVITNTTENYKILENYTLNQDKWFLTDGNGIPQVMVWCGNPMKLIDECTSWDNFVQTCQNITYDVLYIFPPTITYTIVGISQPLSGEVALVSSSPTPTSTLAEGEQWAVEGQLMVKATPADPQPGETVTITVRVIPVESNLGINYNVSGTDGYTDSGSSQTDAQGEIKFTIPGSYSGVKDSIQVEVPQKNLSGSTSYTF